MGSKGIDDLPASLGPTPVDISVALSPNNLDAVPKLLEEITAGVQALKTGGDTARHELAVKARAMMQALETPRETSIKHLWAQVRYVASLYLKRLAVMMLTPLGLTGWRTRCHQLWSGLWPMEAHGQEW